MKTIGITASIKNKQLVVDRSIIDTVVKLGYLPLVFALFHAILDRKIAWNANVKCSL